MSAESKGTGTVRARNAVRNSFFSVLTQVALIVFAALSNRVVNHRIGEALIGLNGTITNVLGILSVTELGFSTAVIYHLYRGMAEKNEKEVAELINLYRRAYFVIAGIILVIGLCLLPLLPAVMKDNPFSDGYTRTLYLLWLFRTVFSYLQAYLRSVLIADQKEYLVSITMMAIQIINNLSIVAIVYFTGDYLPALIANIAVEVFLYWCLNRYILKSYPYLRTYRKIQVPEGLRKGIYKDIKDVFVSRLSLRLLGSTDNLIITGIISVVVSGLYNNYLLITNAVSGLASSVSNSIQPVIGNLFLEKDQDKNETVLSQMLFLFFLIGAFFSVALQSLLSPFITLWLGERYVLAPLTVTLLSVCIGISVLNMPLGAVMTAAGLFRCERNLSALSAVANLAASLLLVWPLGVSGVVIGTILAYLIQLVVRLIYFCRHYLGRGVQRFFGELAIYFLLAGAEIFAMARLAALLKPQTSAGRLLLVLLLCILIPNLCNLLIFCRTKRWKGLIRIMRSAKSGGTKK
ncbi:MAG: hypothetical protein IJT05_01745 [Lachnospiraceae bacterium]|nr:hypothetical protein [Lachnospiraceae bacterium]